MIISSGLALADRKLSDEEAEKIEVSQWYKAGTGKEPTLSNLLKSLEGDKRETSLALEVLLTEPKTNKISEKVLQCAETHKDDDWIKFECGQYLITLNSTKNEGIEILRMIISTPNTDLSTRLFAAKSLAEVGILDGYPLVKDGLSSSFAAERGLAVDLLKEFSFDNGKQYNKKGDKINIEETVISFKDKVDPKTSAALLEIQNKLSKK